MQSTDASIVSEKSQAVRGTLLCLHGLTGAPLEMEQLAVVGRNRGFFVSLPLLRGHAQGRVSDLAAVELEDWLGDVELELLKLWQRSPGEPIVVAGLSFGALLALYLAGRHPEKIVATFACSVPYVVRNSLSHAISRLGSHLPELILSRFGSVAKSDRRPNRWALPRQAMEQHSVGAVMRMHKLIRLVDRQLGQIAGRVLLLQDPHDHHLAPAASSALAAKLVNASVEVVLLPRGEHELTVGWSHRQVEQRLASVLDDFLVKI